MITVSGNKRLLGIGVLGFVMVSFLGGCSSSGTSTGGGASSWSGDLRTSSGRLIPFQLSMNFTVEDDGENDTVFPSRNITGVFSTSTSNPCFTGGTIDKGTLDGGNIQFAVNHGGGTLNFSGTTSGSRMSGLWSNAGSVVVEIETVNDEGETETESKTYNCAGSGEFYAR